MKLYVFPYLNVLKWGSFTADLGTLFADKMISAR